MHLSYNTANSWSIVAYHDKQVFSNKSHSSACLHDLDMCKALSVGADLILAFDNEDSSVAQHAMRFPSCIEVQIQHSLVILASRLSSRPIIPVVDLKVLV